MSFLQELTLVNCKLNKKQEHLRNKQFKTLNLLMEKNQFLGLWSECFYANQ